MAARIDNPLVLKRLLASAVLCLVGLASTPAEAGWTNIFPGVGYSQWQNDTPQRITAVRVDLCHAGVELRATKSSERGRTPSSFANLVGADVVINADFFLYSDYSTRGLAIGDGNRWPGSTDTTQREFIAFGNGQATVSKNGEHVTDYGWMNEAVGGWFTVLDNNQVKSYSSSHCTTRHPRTIVGLSRDERTLYMVVVDGRTSSSVGMTCQEQGTLMKGLGAWNSISLDGGGSSAMWVRGKGVASHPSGGSQRVVGNHLAVIADGSGAPEACNDLSADFSAGLADADDFYTQGSSAGVPDLLVGDEFELNLMLKNTASAVYRGVQVDYDFGASFITPTDYAIYSDHPAYDQQSWELNSADSNDANPPRAQMGDSGTLEMDAFSPKESKRVKIVLRADRYSVGESPRPRMRGWVRNITDFYSEQSAWDQTPSTNQMDALLQDIERIDILSPREWQFNGGEGQFEGWTACGPENATLTSNADTTAMLAEGANAAHCAQSPGWTSVDATTYDQMVIRLRTTGAGGNLRVGWKDVDSTFGAPNQVHFAPTQAADTQTYVLDFASIAAWGGTITGLQLGWAPQTFDRMAVDAIFFQDSAEQTTSSASEEFVDQPAVAFEDDNPSDSGDVDELPDAGASPDSGNNTDIDATSNNQKDAGFDPIMGQEDGQNSIDLNGGCGCNAGGAGESFPGGMAFILLLGAGVWARRKRRESN